MNIILISIYFQNSHELFIYSCTFLPQQIKVLTGVDPDIWKVEGDEQFREKWP